MSEADSGAAIRAALSEYGSADGFDLRAASVQPLGDGLINETFLVEAGGFCGVLQRVNRGVVLLCPGAVDAAEQPDDAGG